ncbi:MAG TPA: GNAT family N-acetyltransferase [Anaeromyxobacteraceae bacterium]|nr:GNAT family N-acetyltransferase [Anaeromyxobacteraceae bacterium]
MTAAGADRAADGAVIHLEEVGSVGRLHDVERAWEDLWWRAPAATPFSSPAWLLPWCDHLLRQRPWALLAWRGASLVGLFPGLVYRRSAVRVLGLLGGGASDYQDALVADGAAAGALLAAVARRSDAFDVADLEALPPWSPLLGAAPPDGLERTVEPQERCPVLPLPARFDDLSSRTSHHLLSDVRYRQRRLQRRGGFEIARADASTLEEFLAELFRLHQARWATRSRPGVLRGRDLARFHRDSARALLARGMLRLYAMRVGGATVGVLHCVAARARTYAYASALDPAAASHSPGSLLFAHAIERAIAEGCRELDFLRGDEQYKYRWGAEDRMTSRLVLAPRARERAHLTAPL